MKLEDLKVGQEGEFEGELMLFRGIRIQGEELYGSDDCEAFPEHKDYLIQTDESGFEEIKVFEYLGGTPTECIDGMKLESVKIRRLK